MFLFTERPRPVPTVSMSVAGTFTVAIELIKTMFKTMGTTGKPALRAEQHQDKMATYRLLGYRWIGSWKLLFGVNVKGCLCILLGSESVTAPECTPPQLHSHLLLDMSDLVWQKWSVLMNWILQEFQHCSDMGQPSLKDNVGVVGTLSEVEIQSNKREETKYEVLCSQELFQTFILPHLSVSVCICMYIFLNF